MGSNQLCGLRLKSKTLIKTPFLLINITIENTLLEITVVTFEIRDFIFEMKFHFVWDLVGVFIWFVKSFRKLLSLIAIFIVGQ